MAFIQSDLDELESAIKKGTTLVRYRDGEVRYRTLDEMIRLRKLMKAELGQVSKKKRTVPVFKKGLGR